MGYSSQDDDEDDVEREMSEEPAADGKQSKARSQRKPQEGDVDDIEDEDFAAGWGSSKQDYYNADNIETEADALEEEQEARRLQKKHLQGMTEADYAFDEDEWLDASKGGEDGDNEGVVTEVLPQLQIRDDMSAAEKLKILKTRYPEFEPLSKEYVTLQEVADDLALSATGAQAAQSRTKATEKPKTPIAVIKYRALSAYLGSLAMYFTLFTSTAQNSEQAQLAMSATELKDHPIMESLMNCRALWERLRDVPIPDVSEMDGVDGISSSAGPKTITANAAEKPSKTKQKPEKKPKKSKAEKAADAAQAEADARRAERIRTTEANLADLSSLIPKNIRKKSKPTTSKPSQLETAGSDFGEETSLTPQEAEEKAKRKKSLRFYTSQIAQKSNKREAAGRDAGGDADLPYRERFRDKQARLNAEAENRAKKRGDAHIQLGDESDEEDRRAAREIRGDAGPDSEDDYYDMVAARANKRKADKQELAQAHAEAARSGGRVEVQEGVGPDGKRKISYAIEKNKGLTPKRNKDVRNPRVKKRKKFEEKKKKLGSIRPVYKGGEGRGGYGGELTGIKKGLIRSVKL